MLNRTRLFIVLMGVFVATEGYAFGPTESNAVYTKQLTELKRLYKLGKKQLEEFQEQTKMLEQVRDFYNEMKQQKHVLRDWRFWKEKLLNDVKEFRDLSSISDLVYEGELDQLMSVVEKRLAHKEPFSDSYQQDRATLATKMVILKAVKTAQHVKHEDPQDVVSYNKIQEIVEQDERKRRVVQELASEIDYVFGRYHKRFVQ